MPRKHHTWQVSGFDNIRGHNGGSDALSVNQDKMKLAKRGQIGLSRDTALIVIELVCCENIFAFMSGGDWDARVHHLPLLCMKNRVAEMIGGLVVVSLDWSLRQGH
ncbi:hypothetical protein EG328_000321 [Venturia inaequalis]|uniref:Uncharacterized protein n=1 Tax=Venturia inaequalis TaxID=5025 RepID=A0A8H3V1F8_VENIN|nr:hypothetical protein EG328_000321 [Venturia inaequalis]